MLDICSSSLRHSRVNIPSQDSGISDSLRARDDHEDLAGQVGRDLARAGRDGGEGGLALVDEAAELGAGGLAGVGEDEGLAGGDADAAALQRDGGEGLDGQVRPARARRDEGRGQREHGARAQRRVEGVRHGDGVRGCADERLVAGFDGDDLGGGGEDRSCLDLRCGTEVGGNADGFKHTGRGDHIRNGIQGEVVCALLHWRSAGGGDGSRQLRDMSRLGTTDGHQFGDLSCSQTGSFEITLLELGKALGVEGCFQMLKGESELENIDISQVTLTNIAR